jgi:hypothetical protein
MGVIVAKSVSATPSAGGAGTVTSVDGSGGTTGLTLTGGPIVNSGTLTLGGTLNPANGGTGVANGSNNKITFAGNFSLGLTLTANTSVTLPTTGTLINSTDTAAKATILATPRAINGVNFDGSANITINAVDITPRIASAEKNASNGVPSLSGFNLTVVNTAGTVISSLTNANTAPHTYTLPNKTGTVALTSDFTDGILPLSHTGLTFTSGTNVDQLSTITKSLTLTTAWQDVGINSTDLATGTYIIQLYADDVGVGGSNSNEYYSGTLSWYAGDTDSALSSPTDEIALHRAGGSSEGGIFLRTFRTALADPLNMKLQIFSNVGTSGPTNYIFKFRRMI